ncbi:hypothetical protein FRC01_009249 [Tulasnella sp. 417]|nr:hypothetical protein FRC01_009249 [Tulasnella sp. 417]
MGYLGLDDSRIRRPFECFKCRLDGCPRVGMLSDDARVEVENTWRALCLFRRALKIAKDGAVPQTALALSKRLGCSNNLGQQMKKRLEDEGFIGPEIIETVDVFEDPAPAKGKAKAKKPPKAKKGKLVMFWSEVNKRKFMRYFKPGGTFERAIYNFNTGGAGHQARSLKFPDDQTQPEGPSTPKAPRKNSKTSTAAPYSSCQPLLPLQETTLLPVTYATDHQRLTTPPRSSLKPTAALEDVFPPSLSARKRPRSARKVVTYASRKKLKMSMASGDLDMEE